MKILLKEVSNVKLHLQKMIKIKMILSRPKTDSLTFLVHLFSTSINLNFHYIQIQF